MSQDDAETPKGEAMQEKKIGFLLLAFLVGVIAGLGFGFAWTSGRTRATVQAEAVKAGHARHKVVDEFGRTVFEWLPAHPQEPAGQQK